MILGSVKIHIYSENKARLIRDIKSSRLPVRGLTPTDEGYKFWISAENLRKVKKLGYDIKILDKNGLIRQFEKIYRHPGMVFGLLITIPLMVFYSNIIIRLDIETDKEEIRKGVIEVLKDQGIYPGKYIPNIDLTIAERELRKRVEGIAWAGISRTGSGLSVDIIEVIPEADSLTRGMPCDLVASDNGIIEEIEVLDGQVIKGVGCGVVKGDVIVSGKIITEKSEWKDGKETINRSTRYTKSIGKVYGTIYRTVEFYQPYETTLVTFTGHEDKIRYIQIFDAKIPLFFDIPKGTYTLDDNLKMLQIRGYDLPFGINTIVLKQYNMTKKMITKDDAKSLAEQRSYKYEQNFLKEYEIRDRKTEYIENDNGITLRVSYELYGQMSRERNFFIPKENELKQSQQD